MIVYVDDIILTSDDEEKIKNMKYKMTRDFEIKDLWPLKFFLGMEFARYKEGIFINQRKYILDIAKETGLLVCKIADTPVEVNVKLVPIAPEKMLDRGRF